MGSYLISTCMKYVICFLRKKWRIRHFSNARFCCVASQRNVALRRNAMLRCVATQCCVATQRCVPSQRNIAFRRNATQRNNRMQSNYLKFVKKINHWTQLAKILQNAQPLFPTQTLARTNYWAELAEILHGNLLGDSAWDSRGVFWNSIWGPCNGVPLGGPSGVKDRNC